MAMRKRTQDLERVTGRNSSGAFEDVAKSGDLRRRPLGDVGEGAVVNLTVFAEGLAQQDGGRGVAVRDDRYVHVDIFSQLARTHKLNIIIYMTTIIDWISDNISKINVFT
jgi:hypothetical protein